MRYDGTVAGLSVDVPTAAEVPALITLVNTLATEPNFFFINPIDPVNGVAVVRNHLETIAASATEAVLVAHIGTDLAGLITGTRGVHPARRGAVDVGLGVRPDWRRRGIGQMLLRALERWARGGLPPFAAAGHDRQCRRDCALSKMRLRYRGRTLCRGCDRWALLRRSGDGKTPRSRQLIPPVHKGSAKRYL